MSRSHRQSLPSVPQLHTVSGCNNLYVKKGKNQKILDYFDITFGARFIVLDCTADKNIFRVRYLVVESQRHPEMYHWLVGRDLLWVVKDGLQFQTRAVRRRLDKQYEQARKPNATAHDFECRVSVFLVKYFAQMLNGMVEAAGKHDSLMVEDLYRWIHNLTRVSDAVVRQHQSCGIRHHQQLVSEAYDRLLKVILKSKITVNQAPNRLSPVCVYEDSDFFLRRDHLAMRWSISV
ncbi:hypothetical protein N8T08_004618 [Aspergillus melleus]|uniref:Uncharacterized protein n=1 Tax=Aspergillus melleus TaxID=138277 RepID=A0ACC3B4N2_9EURO|nr:hypothetical protein N8T08_004618 [Aspergillus melleus]